MYMPVSRHDVNEKSLPLHIVDTPIRNDRSMARKRIVRYVIPCILLLTTLILLSQKLMGCQHRGGLLQTSQTETQGTEVPVRFSDNTRVKLEAHIMSKCPDARDCLQRLVLPAMQEVSDKVDFRLSYIGSVDTKSDSVSCKHGPGECLGNMIQLCAQRIYPDPKLFLGFANCMTESYADIPNRDLVESCAMEHGLNFTRINKCISDEGHGAALLRESIERSEENHVKISCTIRLEDRVRCVRDGGEWYDCPGGSKVSSLVDEIKRIYEERN